MRTSEYPPASLTDYLSFSAFALLPPSRQAAPVGCVGTGHGVEAVRVEEAGARGGRAAALHVRHCVLQA